MFICFAGNKIDTGGRTGIAYHLAGIDSFPLPQPEKTFAEFVISQARKIPNLSSQATGCNGKIGCIAPIAYVKLIDL